MIDTTDTKSVMDTTHDDKIEENSDQGSVEEIVPALDEHDKESSDDEVREPSSRRDVRALAFHYVYAADRNDYAISLDDLVAQYETHFGISVEEAAFSLELAKGAIENRDQLDEDIKPLLENWKLERLGCCTRLILRMALWELQQPEAIPSIVINEAVELAKGFAEKDAYKFINGILDEARKRSEKEDDKDETDEPSEGAPDQSNEDDPGESDEPIIAE